MPLKRTLTLPLLTFYGLGSIIGAGIYALIGSVAQEARFYTPFSFLIAAIIALFTAASYAELSSRYPESAGSSLYINKAFNRAWLSGLVGWLVVTTGIVSCGALIHGFINYLHLYIATSNYILIPIIVFILGCITLLGITESAVAIFVMTVMEIGGLLIIIWYGKHNFSKVITDSAQFIPTLNLQTWLSILSGSFIAFYAFIGFEDMVNVAEETKNPQKTMPQAIFLAAFSATILYVLVSIITIVSLPDFDLMSGKTPLTLIIKQQGHSPLLFSILAMISISNGVLVNIIMASRLIYGMTKLRNAPQIFSKIYERTQVPLFSTVLVMFIIIILAYWIPIEKLAKITSTIMLCIFCLMHSSLILIKRKYPKKENHIVVPMFLPIIGLITSILFLVVSVGIKMF